MTTLTMPIAYLEIGQKAEVVDIKLSGDKRRRLLDLGLNVGAKVQCVIRGVRGGPTAFEVKGSVFALREEDGKRILVRCSWEDLCGEVAYE